MMRKKILSKVLGVELVWLSKELEEDNSISYTYLNKDGVEVSNNVSYNTLIHRCIIWIQNQGLDINIGFDKNGKTFCEVFKEEELLHATQGGVEIENILKTCQWVYTH